VRKSKWRGEEDGGDKDTMSRGSLPEREFL